MKRSSNTPDAPKKASYRSPVYEIRAVPVEKVVANSYNPNIVAPPEMKLLELSIWEDGYTMPCVCYYDAEHDRYELVDGYHRYMVLKTSKRIYARERGLLPVAVIEKDLSNRIASTIRHNRARGTHNLELMSEIVAELTKANMSDRWIMRHIGMDSDELLRLKQITGLAELFAGKPFSAGGPDDSEATEPEEPAFAETVATAVGKAKEKRHAARDEGYPAASRYEIEARRAPDERMQTGIRKAPAPREKQRVLFEEEVLA